MRTAYLSTLTINNGPRANLPRLQGEVLKANTELTTGVRADLGLDLGVRSGMSVSLRQEQATLQSLIDGNALSIGQLDTADAALTDIKSKADDFIQTLIGAPSEINPQIIRDAATNNMTAFTSAVNASDGRRYVFGGTNTSQKPLKDFEDGPQAAVQDAFNTYFGLDPSDPGYAAAVNQIDADDMKAFLDPATTGGFAEQFNDANWQANWSVATDDTRTSVISPTEKVTVSSSANETAIRKLAMVYSMVGELGGGNLNANAFGVVIDKAREIAGEAVSDVTTVAARLGASKQRVDNANTAMKQAQGTLNDRLVAVEAVDPAEAKSRVDALTTQIEMSYSLTNQIMQLSIINYV